MAAEYVPELVREAWLNGCVARAGAPDTARHEGTPAGASEWKWYSA